MRVMHYIPLNKLNNLAKNALEMNHLYTPIKNTRDLLSCMLDKSYPVELLLWPIDDHGYKIPLVCIPHIYFGCYIKSGHLLERIMELLILTGISHYGKVKCFHGKLSQRKRIKDITSYLDGKINKGSENGVCDIVFEKDNILYLISCKYYKQEKYMNKYDVDNIYANAKVCAELKDSKFKIGLCINNKNDFFENFKKSRNESVKMLLYDQSNVFDVQDIYSMIYKLRSTDITNIFSLFDPKPYMSLHIHQEVIAKTLHNMLINNPGEKFMLAAIPRCGKSIIIAYIIFLMKTGRFLIFTNRINETKDGFTTDLFHKYIEFSDYKVNLLSYKNKGLIDDEKCIDIGSKQYLDRLISKKSKNINDVEIVFELDEKDVNNISEESVSSTYLDDNQKYDVIFIDESHEGGSTEHTQKIIEKYSSNHTCVVYVSATCQKPVFLNSIPSKNCVFWTLDDVHNLANGNIDPLERFSGYDEYTTHIYPSLSPIQSLSKLKGKDIQSYYKSIPRLVFMTNQFSQHEETRILLEKCRDRDLGLSMRALFLVDKNGKFKNEHELNILIKMISGTYDDATKKKKCFINRIKTHQMNNGGRTHRNDIDNEIQFLGLLFFLPIGQGVKIEDTGSLFKKLIEGDRILRQYEVVNLDEIKGDYVSVLKGRYNTAKNKGNRGIIIIACKKCSLGVSLPFIDAVFLFNNMNSGDLIYQMSFRCLTEDIGKKHGYVIDMNPMRVLQSMMTYFPQKKDSVPTTIRYLIESNIIEVDSDLFDSKIIDTNTVINTFINLWQEKGFHHDTIEEIKHSELLSGNNVVVSKLKYKILMGIDSKTGINKIPTGININIESDSDEEKELIDEDTDELSSEENEKDDSSKKDKEITLEMKREKIRHILSASLVVLSILTMNNKETDIDFLLDVIDKSALVNKIKNIFSYEIPFRKLSEIIKNNKQHIANSLYVIKQNILSISRDKKKLLNYINLNLSPRDIEKRTTGEVFTPLEFVDEMLDLLEKQYPGIFTLKNYKWLDPCNGIGNFPICLYYRLMNGLKDQIVDEAMRRKHIFENMIYVCEIDKTNTEIYRRSIETKGYNINVYRGDFTRDTIDRSKDGTKITKKFLLYYFGVEYFDVVIGNPPYQKNAKGGYGNSSPYYNEFIDCSAKIADIVMFVTPSRWFSGGKGLDRFRKKILDSKNIVFLKHYKNSKDVFPKTNISGGVSIICIDYRHKSDCKFIQDGQENIVDLGKFDIMFDTNYIQLVEKFSNNPKIKTLDAISSSRNLYGIETNGSNKQKKTIFLEKPTDTTLACHTSKKYNFIQYIEKSDLKIPNKRSLDSLKYWKVITTKTGNKSNFGRTLVCKPDEVHSNSYFSFEVMDENQAESLISYMKCKLPRLMLSLRKSTQDISPKTCKWIPLVPLNRIWTNKSVYAHFNLSNTLKTLISDHFETEIPRKYVKIIFEDD